MSVDGHLVFSKHKARRFPRPKYAEEEVRKRTS
ncbi:MAG: hypothetical protein ACE5HJ_03255 [Thermoplasmata archaeon]